MRPAGYQITIINPFTGKTLIIFQAQRTFNLKYSRKLLDIGKFSFALPASQRDWIDFIPLDALVEIRRFGTVESVEGVYFVRKFDRFTDGLQERVVLSGPHVTSLLQRRIIDPDRDPQEAGGYSTKVGAAGDVIREYVQEQFSGTGAVVGFSVPVPAETGRQVGADLRYENLYEEVKKLAKRGEVDFEIRRPSGRELELFIGRIGTDNSLSTRVTPPYSVFSPQRNNIQNPRLTIDYGPQKTVVYALGDGDGENRDILRVSQSGPPSPYSTIETKIDVRNSNKGQDVSLLTAAGIKLIEAQAEQQFTFDIIEGRSGVTYQRDWALGDSFTVKWDSFQQNLRVVGVTVSLDSTNENIEPEINILR